MSSSTSSISPVKTDTSPNTQTGVPTSTSFGRRIVQIGAQIVRNIPRVAYVAAVIGLCALVVLLPAVAYAAQHRPPAQRFSPYTARFMNNGLQLVNNGTAACVIDTPLETQEACKRAVDTFTTRLGGSEAIYASDDTFREKGIPLLELNQQPHGSKTMHLRLNSQKFTNYEAALQYVEDEIVSKPLPFQGTPSETIAMIKEIHRRLSLGLPETRGETTPGKFRKDWLIIDAQEQPERIPVTAQEQLTRGEYKIFMRGWDKLRQSGDLRQLTTKEVNVLNKVIYIPPGPDEIEQEMNTFAQELKIKLQQGGDPIDTASFVHTEIARISSFVDANGRLARILMNAILRHQGGFDSAVFDSDKRYSEVVDKSIRETRVVFTNYLREHVIPWTAAQKDALDPDAIRSA